MKTLLYILVFGILSCHDKTSKAISDDTTTTIQSTQKTDNSKYYTTDDTLIITTEIGDTLKYGKQEFNKIIDFHPELLSEYPQDPDLTYYCHGEKGEFNSEVGKDDYYVLYAYFLKQKNGKEKFKSQRQKLINIYNNINSLFAHFQYGGTYFGHQILRILGYTEFSIYLYPKETDHVKKTYDITIQKKLYIQSLRQLIKDESKIDFQTLGKEEKKESNIELNKIIDELNILISDNFYLRRAQEFHYGHYEYY